MSARRKRLWQLALKTSLEAEDAVSELLARVAGCGATSYTDVDRHLTTVSIFLGSRKDWSRLKAAELGAGLKRLADLGIKTAPAKVSFRQLRPEDWRECWKRHFRCFEVSPLLLVKPGWTRRKPRYGQAVIVLDPGLSFGTGQHPTTAFCLRKIASLRSQFRSQPSLLDLGTGSGILAIAAAKLGYCPVYALECDPDALRCARANACRNRVLTRLRLVCQDLGKLPGRSRESFNVVCANLTANLLLEHRDRILSRLAPGGALVVAGILTTEFRGLQQHFEESGLRLTTARTEGEWRSGMFRRP